MAADLGRVASPNRLSSATEPVTSLGPAGFDPARIAAVTRSMQHYLSHKLEGFSNGNHYPPSSPANKTNGYVAAKVPDWQLRQWIADLTQSTGANQ